MLIKNLLVKIDCLFCSYLGFAQEEVRPNTVQIQGEKLIVTNTSSFKRHLLKETWDNFNNAGIKQIRPEARERLGIAIGKAIAKNLVVSFEEISINKRKV